MKLSTRMIVGWVAVFAGGAATLAFAAGGWFFLAALILADLLRTRFEPRIPVEVERRRRWILLPLFVLYFGLILWADFPESTTHPVHIAGGIGFAAVVGWLIRDDIKVYRQIHATRPA